MATVDNPLLIFIRGLPGSGKSYISSPLAAAITTTSNRRVTVLDPDATDYSSTEYANHVKQQLAEGVDPALHAYRFLRAQAYQAITDHAVVIWNQPFSNLEVFNKMVARMHEQAEREQTTATIVIVEVMIDPAQAHKRVVARKNDGGHGPSDATFERFAKDYYSFANEGYTIITVQGDDAIETSVAHIVASLQPLL